MDYAIEYKPDDNNKSWMVNVTGEIDIFNSADMKEQLLKIINEKNYDLVIDCKNLEYMDSTALGALVAVLKNVKAYGGHIRLRHTRPNLLKLFKITNLDKVFIIEGESNE